MLEVLYAVVLVAAVLAGYGLMLRFRVVAASGSAAGDVCAIIPARNEQNSLPALLESLDRSTVPVRVLVIDDASTDATVALAREAGVEVISPGTPAPGWTGKAWACHVGANSTDAELLLFLDADTVLESGALGGIVDLHRRFGGLISVQPYHRVQRTYEQLSAYFNAVAVMASGVFTSGVGRRPMAFGPCLLTSRDDYERAGGHAAVRGEILDDVELAAAYEKAGLSVYCVAGGSQIRMRSYPNGIRQLVAGWTKNMASGAAATDPRAGLATGLWICAHHLVAVNILFALWTAAGDADEALPAGIWLLAWVVFALQLRVILRRVGSFRWWTWALFPLPLLAFDLLFAISTVNTLRGSVRWRGRTVRLGA